MTMAMIMLDAKSTSNKESAARVIAIKKQKEKK